MYSTSKKKYALKKCNMISGDAINIVNGEKGYEKMYHYFLLLIK